MVCQLDEMALTEAEAWDWLAYCERQLVLRLMCWQCCSVSDHDGLDQHLGGSLHCLLTQSCGFCQKRLEWRE